MKAVSVQNSQDWIMMQATVKALKICVTALHYCSKQSFNCTQINQWFLKMMSQILLTLKPLLFLPQLTLTLILLLSWASQTICSDMKYNIMLKIITLLTRTFVHFLCSSRKTWLLCLLKVSLTLAITSLSYHMIKLINLMMMKTLNTHQRS